MNITINSYLDEISANELNLSLANENENFKSDCKFQIPPSIYFGGCAFGSIFYVGVYKAMIEKWGADFPKKTIIYGDSAGVIMVLGITQQIPPDLIGEFYRNTGLNAPGGIFHGGMNSLETHSLKKLLKDFSDPLLYEKLNGKMFIGGSTFFAKHFWTCKWRDNEDLYSCMRNSFHVPCLCDRSTKVNGAEIVDGAFIFSGEDLPHGDNTLYVADDNCAEISMKMTPNELLYPQLGDDYDRMVKLGYDAFMAWDGAYKKKLGIRKPNYSIQTILWMLKLIELFFALMKYLFSCGS